MGYDLYKIESVEAITIPVRIRKSNLDKYGISETEYENLIHYKKADAQIKILIKIGNILKVENISLKKANSNADFNQIDKRTVDSYQYMWNFDNEIGKWLKLFTGELKPTENDFTNLRDDRRLYIDEMPENIQKKIVNFFDKNRIIIVSDIIKGRGGLSANWMLVTNYDVQNDFTTWILKDINTVMNFFGSGDIKLSSKGSLYIGKITMQRKGGTPDPTKLQFKISPCKLFDIDNNEGI